MTARWTNDAKDESGCVVGDETKIIPGHGVAATREAAVELREVALEVLSRVASEPVRFPDYLSLYGLATRSASAGSIPVGGVGT